MTEIPTPSHDADEDRRKFLATCGKFAVVTPPAITLLLSTSLHSPAIAYSGGRGGGIKGSVHGGGIQGSNGRSWGGRGSWGGSKS